MRWNWAGASLLFLLQGLSLCLFYNTTFYGMVSSPLLYPPALLTPLAYYLAMSHSISAWLQAVLWLACALGSSWALVLSQRWLAQRWSLEKPGLSACLYAALPLTLPGVWLAYRHAWTPNGPSLDQFIKACLVRRFEAPVPDGLVFLFHALALVALALETGFLSQQWGLRKAATVQGAAFFLALVLVNVVASLLGLVLHRGW